MNRKAFLKQISAGTLALAVTSPLRLYAKGKDLPPGNISHPGDISAALQQRIKTLFDWLKDRQWIACIQSLVPGFDGALGINGVPDLKVLATRLIRDDT